MPRLSKQLLYGIFFLVIFGAVIYGIYSIFVKSAPSCFDRRQNQGEEGVDCGRVCSSTCLPGNLQAIETQGAVRIFYPRTGRVTLLARLQNANLNFAVKAFDYKFTLFNSENKEIKSALGKSYIHAGEIKYLAAFVDLQDEHLATRAEITLTNVDWVTAGAAGKPMLVVQEHRTTLSPLGVETAGSVLNNDAVNLDTVKIMALLRGNAGQALGVSETEVGGLAPGESRSFTIFHPPMDELDLQKTEIFVSSQK